MRFYDTFIIYLFSLTLQQFTITMKRNLQEISKSYAFKYRRTKIQK